MRASTYLAEMHTSGSVGASSARLRPAVFRHSCGNLTMRQPAHLRVCPGIVLLVALCSVLAGTALAQDRTPVFHATSDLVLLDVQVIHYKTNTPMGELKATDFELSEDGVPQKISFFGRDQLPLSVVLLFDLTGSDWRILRRLAEGARNALEHLVSGP